MCREPRLAASDLQQVQKKFKSRRIFSGLERSDKNKEKGRDSSRPFS
jgi:hypothetical protein